MKAMILFMFFIPLVSNGQIAFQVEKKDEEKYDLSSMDSTVIEREGAYLTFFLQGDQSIENTRNGYIFHIGTSGKNIPVKLTVEGEKDENCTISTSGCMVMHKADHYLIKNQFRRKFTVLVAVRNKSGSSTARGKFIFMIAQ